jgi:hypothetical protein
VPVSEDQTGPDPLALEDRQEPLRKLTPSAVPILEKIIHGKKSFKFFFDFTRAGVGLDRPGPHGPPGEDPLSALDRVVKPKFFKKVF